MRIPSSLGLTAELACLIQLWPIATHVLPRTQGVNYTPVPPPGLDLTSLGRVALTGNFDAISIYTYQQQTEDAFSTNGTQSLITRLPNGDFANAANADGYIKTMCPFVMQNGTLAGIIVGGNFTSLGGVQAQAVAMYDPSSAKVTPLTGLNGTANALLCDRDSNTVYVGGQFKGSNSTNAIIWVGDSGWANLPFEGFNGPVNSIIKGSNGTVIFGGSFTGIGNKTAPAKKDQQVINVSSANLTSGGTSTTAGFNNESNIVCKTSGKDGAGNTWLLQDNTPGFWRADMNFGYEPSLLRIWNTHHQGRGTKTFRFTAIPLNGIMNFTFTDPETGKDAYCDARCPLSSNPSIPYQDFRFFNTVGMSAFRIDISDWYGQGGGLNGIELFQNGVLLACLRLLPQLIVTDVFAYAENDLNEPSCANIDFPSKASVTGPWTVTPSGKSYSRYLSADLSGGDTNSQDVSVVFQPDIKQQGNYSVTIYTPGCLEDKSCDRRGKVNVTGNYATSTAQGSPLQIEIYQTNNYDKYDEIYRGPVDVSNGDFRPSVTLTPLLSQRDNVMLVAQRVQFSLIGNATSTLNGLYEFDPNSQTPDTDFSNSTMDQAGADLDRGALITSMAILGNATYVAGNFSDKSAGFENIFAIGSGNSTPLPNGGLNAQVSSMLVYEDLLFLGGNFTNTMNGSVPGLNNVAAFNTTSQAWKALGAGVNGAVNTVVSLIVNVTTNTPELCISFNGFFNRIEASGSDKAVSVDGFGVWVPSRQNWLQNLHLQSQAITGQLSTMTNITGGTPLLAGTLSTEDISASDAVALTSDPLRIQGLNIGIQPQPAGPVTRKRAVSNQNVSGVVTGLFETDNNLNVTVLGGHFTATASNGSTIENLAFINNAGNSAETITGLTSGLDSDSAFLALATINNLLYAGGTVTGRVNDADVNGLVVYDLSQGAYSYPQPPVLGGSDVAVNAITKRPNKAQVFVGGHFDTAGSLGCPSVCVFENGAWNQPGIGIGGSVAAFMWQGNNKLLAGGNLTVMNNATSLANYDTARTTWTALNGVSGSVPGPVTALTQASSDSSHFWVAGKASNNSAFLMRYDGSNFQTVGDVLGNKTTIRGLSVLALDKERRNANNLVSSGMTLLVTGELDLPNFGNASAALFNGTTFSPFILSTSGNGPGSLSQLFSEKQVSFKDAGGPMAVGFVVLISLACALGAIFLLVVAGILIERYRRKHDGYTPAPTTYFDKTSNMGRIPPEHLFGRLGQSRHPPML
ncbi:MAG: hypothetical protein Q9217_005061 [Psora testacea]